MKERPILFSGPMVRAILEGRKTVTRRACKPQPSAHAHTKSVNGMPMSEWWETGKDINRCPYGQPGDRLWIREAWAQINVAQAPGESWVVYRECDNRTDYGGPWKPSIHMRRRDSRILLEITAVRVERLQDISDDQCRAEGATGGHGSIPGYIYNATVQEHFRHIWTSTGGDYDANPWVWVIEFKRVTP
ncbi:MAG: hypothetical protein GAK45_01441 [Pseudomonas citronellolis]|nr:MAG: hypothetical protein GAK45_01441 [Pseudomonas citronellolis]